MGVSIDVTLIQSHPSQQLDRLLFALDGIGDASLPQGSADNVAHCLAGVQGGIRVLEYDLRQSIIFHPPESVLAIGIDGHGITVQGPALEIDFALGGLV